MPRHAKLSTRSECFIARWSSSFLLYEEKKTLRLTNFKLLTLKVLPKKKKKTEVWVHSPQVGPGSKSKSKKYQTNPNKPNNTHQPN